MKKIIFLIILFLIPLTLALDSQTITPCGGDVETIFECFGDNQNTFFANLKVSPVIIIPGGGGGGTIILQKNQLSPELCSILYEYAEMNITNLPEILNFSKDTVNLYLNNWQLICSDLVNKSLNQEFICREIPFYNNYLDLKSNLLKKINISDYLIKYYVDNYNKICGGKTFSLVPENDSENGIYLVIFILIAIVVIVMVINRKRILKAMD